jgi:putative hydrolase of the HAD superfamily
MFDVIAFDADDTLWHNETRYIQAQNRYSQLLSRYHSPEKAAQRLDEIELQNIRSYGYGIKSFTLSMIEAAIELTDGQITGREVEEILNLGRQMLTARVELFEQTAETLTRLSGNHDLMLITKGDLFEQGRKVERSGLSQHFRYIEIVAEKTAAVYRALLERHRLRAERFLMVGNSLKSDILPVLEIGGRAVYIPYEHTWIHERVVDAEIVRDGYYELEHLGELPALVEKLQTVQLDVVILAKVE